MILHCMIKVLLIEKQELIFTNANTFTGIDMYGKIIIEHRLNLTRTLIYLCTPREKQYPSSQWDGNQLKCEGEVTRIDNIDISHGIEYEEDEWLIQETTLVTDGNKMKDINNNRILNCKPENIGC